MRREREHVAQRPQRKFTHAAPDVTRNVQCTRYMQLVVGCTVAGWPSVLCGFRDHKCDITMIRPHSVAGFTVLPIRFNAKSETDHFLYYREHRVRDEDATKPASRTLFVVNVPPFCNKECLERLFGLCGKVEDVFIQDKPSSTVCSEKHSKNFPSPVNSLGFQFAFVVFQKSSSVPKAKQLPSQLEEPFLLSTEDKSLLTGYKKWCSDYTLSRPDVDDLQKEIDDFMQEYDAKVQEEELKAKELEGVPDEEGWITVTRKSAKPAVARTEKNQRRLRAKERKKREKTELLNFYTFQMRESKREHIAQLRQKFEEDKQKIAQMKAARKFKPF
ncbi:ribosomal RNA-processing protein 7 homolog A-like [Acanthaster planci]|uniref:Ribosomal RNA-processing protein 7 homolog A-like n=1 Tax=Acanthaster planci TaxID=133434 RepID=A0A8B7YS03_ACAPL|nr:ribosomal RNA-processing protein 7 homolog A-like [Acanthaster planci]